MATHDVHVYAVVRVKLPGIDSVDHLDAINKAVDQLDLHETFDRMPVSDPRVSEMEYADEIAGYLVDDTEDRDYEDSTFHTLSGEVIPLRTPAEAALSARLKDYVETCGPAALIRLGSLLFGTEDGGVQALQCEKESV